MRTRDRRAQAGVPGSPTQLSGARRLARWRQRLAAWPGRPHPVVIGVAAVIVTAALTAALAKYLSGAPPLPVLPPPPVPAVSHEKASVPPPHRVFSTVPAAVPLLPALSPVPRSTPAIPVRSPAGSPRPAVTVTPVPSAPGAPGPSGSAAPAPATSAPASQPVTVPPGPAPSAVLSPPVTPAASPAPSSASPAPSLLVTPPSAGFSGLRWLQSKTAPAAVSGGAGSPFNDREPGMKILVAVGAGR